MFFDKISRRIQPGMVHPLIVDTQWTFQGRQMGDGIFRQHGYPVGIDQIRNAVVNLRVDMVGTSCQYDAVASGLLQVFQCFFSLAHDIPPLILLLLPCQMGGFSDFLIGNVGKFRNQTLRQNLFTGKGQEGIAKENGIIVQLVHVIFDIFRIGGNDGAVIMVDGIFKFHPLIGYAGVEDEFHPVADQPGHMTVGQLGRITF